MPIFYLQIAYPDGRVAQLPAGGALERDLIEDCTKAIVKRGVGVFKTEAQVTQAIREGITEAILNLKRESVQALGKR